MNNSIIPGEFRWKIKFSPKSADVAIKPPSDFAIFLEKLHVGWPILSPLTLCRNLSGGEKLLHMVNGVGNNSANLTLSRIRIKPEVAC